MARALTAGSNERQAVARLRVAGVDLQGSAVTGDDLLELAGEGEGVAVIPVDFGGAGRELRRRAQVRDDPAPARIAEGCRYFVLVALTNARAGKIQVFYRTP